MRDRPNGGDRIPQPALLLGWAGVLPFAGLTLALFLQVALPVSPTVALTAYAAAILSFMGGVQWGVAMRAADEFARGWTGYGLSVLPALLGWLALLAPFRIGLGLLIAGFAGLLLYDLWTVRRGLAPAWYRSLRWQLTAAVVLLLVLALAG